jgi:hypothetical protein
MRVGRLSDEVLNHSGIQISSTPGVIMTTIPPKTSAIMPNTQSETIAKVTFDEVRDSNGHLVGNNSVTFDKTLNFKGTAQPTRGYG